MNAPDKAVAQLPRIFGRYVLIHRLSRGGMGEIFLARFGLEGFEKLAVIKKVLPHLAADEEFISRFITEAQVAVKLQHANIAQVFEVGRVGDEYFLALEHVDGRDLRRTLALLADSGRGMPPDLALFIARDVASALAYAHRRVDEEGGELGLVHCDISPPNVMMSFEGEVKLIDFGIAKSALRALDSTSKTGFGKFGYMAPEQLIRGRQVEARTDLYALGSVLFEMLTGTRLYPAGDTPDYHALATMVANGQHPLPSDHDPSLAPFDELVARALKPDLDDRYRSAAEFRDSIQRQLIGINPTISTDELAAFMRFMFAEDVLAQTQEIERIDKTQLSDFDELPIVGAETVSFAMGQGIAARSRLSGPATSDDSEPIASQAASAASARANQTAKTVRVGLPLRVDKKTVVAVETANEMAGKTELVELAEPVKLRRNVTLVVAGLGVTLFVIAALLWTSRTSTEDDAAPDAVAKTASSMGSIESASAAANSEPATATEQVTPSTKVTIDAGAQSVEPAVPAETARVDKSESVERTDKRSEKTRKTSRKGSGEDPAKDSVTETESESRRDRAARKLRSASAEYKRFRKKHGQRLKSEWNDILLFATYARTDEKARALEKRIERFRGKMRRLAADKL